MPMPSTNVVEFEIPILYEKQLEFCQSKCKYTLYGGARAGGKSFVTRIKAIDLCFKFNGIKVLFLRRTLPDLKKNHVDQFKILLKCDTPQAMAKFNQTDNVMTFKNGSKIYFGYCDTDSDTIHFQGQEYQAIFMDEATQFTEFQFMKFTECLRFDNIANADFIKAYPNFKPRMYLTANPGGVGHFWVKRLFVDRIYRGKEKPEEYKFIQALVFDNQFMMTSNRDYVDQLENLPEKERRAMLYGDWNVFEGQFFEEFNPEIHTYHSNEVQISSNWRLYRTRDYGLDKTACYWIFRDEDGTSYVDRELWESDLTVSDSGNKINEMTYPNEVPYLDLCPPDLWNRQSQTGKSAIEVLMEKCGQYPTKANNDRIVGWLMVKEMLKINPITNKPFLIINADKCPHLIESFQMIQHDEKNPNDCAKQPHIFTHSMDSIRYYCTSWTFNPDPLVSNGARLPFSYDRFALNMGEFEEKPKEEGGYVDMCGDGGWFLQ